MTGDSRKDAPPPMSLKESQEHEKAMQDLESVKDMAIKLAQDYASKYLAPPDSNLWKQELAYLKQNPLDPERRELLLTLAKSASFMPTSWKDFPESYAVRSYFSENLERLMDEFGAEEVHQLLLEYFAGAIRLEENSDDKSPTVFSNKKLCTAFRLVMSVGACDAVKQIYATEYEEPEAEET